MKIVVIGAVAGGTSVMAKARRNSEEVEIVCYTQSEDISYSGCGIPYYIGEDYIDSDKLKPRDVKWFKDRFNIDIFIEHKVLRVIPERKEIVIKELKTGKEFIDNYDKLVIATGGKAKRLGFNNIFYIRDIQDGIRIKKYIDQNEVKNVVIIGGGFIGLEILENLYKKGINITILEKNDRIGGNLDRDIAFEIENYLKEKGIKILLNDSVESIEGGEILTRNGVKLESDLIVGAIGVEPNTEFLKDSGIKLDKIGAIYVNDRLETNIEDIYAVGDCTSVYSIVKGERVYLPLGSTANKMGRILGDRLTGGESLFKGVLGTSIFRVLDLTVGRTGLTEVEAKERGYSVEIIHNIKPNQSEYLKESKEMVIKGIADKKTGKILGVQIVGERGVDKRLDIFVVLITLGATVDQLFHLDLAYAPPFSTTKDPVAYTGMILDNAINGRNKIITPEELEKNRGEYIVIDTRSEKQYMESHIEGAINISLNKIRENIGKLSKKKKIVVHCNKGTTGNATQNILLNNGFDVYNLSGGYQNYKKYIKMLNKK